MSAFRHVDINGCRFYSRPKMVDAGVARFKEAALKAGREEMPTGYIMKEVMQSQAIYLSNFFLRPYAYSKTKVQACGREIMNINDIVEEG